MDLAGDLVTNSVNTWIKVCQNQAMLRYFENLHKGRVNGG